MLACVGSLRLFTKPEYIDDFRIHASRLDAGVANNLNTFIAASRDDAWHGLYEHEIVQAEGNIGGVFPHPPQRSLSAHEVAMVVAIAVRDLIDDVMKAAKREPNQYWLTAEATNIKPQHVKQFAGRVEQLFGREDLRALRRRVEAEHEQLEGAAWDTPEPINLEHAGRDHLLAMVSEMQDLATVATPPSDGVVVPDGVRRGAGECFRNAVRKLRRQRVCLESEQPLTDEFVDAWVNPREGAPSCCGILGESWLDITLSLAQTCCFATRQESNGWPLDFDDIARFREEMQTVCEGAFTQTELTRLAKHIPANAEWARHELAEVSDTLLHNAAFTSITWCGEHFELTRMMGLAIKYLREQWQAGVVETHQSEVLEIIDSTQDRLSAIFRPGGNPHRTWKKVVVSGAGKGTFRYAPSV